MEAPCCRVYYPCKLCHDDLFQFKKGCQTERMRFELVENIQCLNCAHTQPPAEKCSRCGLSFGEYTCLPCRLYENNPEKVKDIFHCVDQGLRRKTARCAAGGRGRQ